MKIRIFKCPSCGNVQFPPSDKILARLNESARCQGCRAGAVLSDRPWLLDLFVDFWKCHEFPASSSWLKHVPTDFSVQ